MGIYASISFTPAFRNASFNKTFAGRLTVPSAAALGTYRQFVWYGRAGDVDMTWDMASFLLRLSSCGGSRDVGKGLTVTVFFLIFLSNALDLGVLSWSYVKWCSLLMLVPCNTKSGAAVVNEGLFSIPRVANFSLVAWVGRPTTWKWWLGWPNLYSDDASSHN